MEVSGKAIVATLAIVVLLMFTIILNIRSSTYESRLDDAYQTSAALMDFISTREYYRLYPNTCGKTTPQDFPMLTNCFREATEGIDAGNAFVEQLFRNPYNDEEGYLAIKNQADVPFQSANFTLHVNGVQVDRGCDMSGDIAPGFTCRFTLEQPCQPGDNMEVRYNRRRAFLRIC